MPSAPARVLVCVAASLLAALPAHAFVTTLVDIQGRFSSGFTESVCTGAIEASDQSPFEFASTSPVVVLSEGAATEDNILDCDPSQAHSCVSRTVTDESRLEFAFDYTGAPGFLTGAVFMVVRSRA